MSPFVFKNFCKKRENQSFSAESMLLTSWAVSFRLYKHSSPAPQVFFSLFSFMKLLEFNIEAVCTDTRGPLFGLLQVSFFLLTLWDLMLQGQGRTDKISAACGAACWGLYSKYMSCTSNNSAWQPMKPDSWGGYQPGVGAKQSQGPGHRHFTPPYLGQIPRGTASLRRFCAFFSLRKEFQKEQDFNHNHTVGREEGRNGGMDRGMTEGGGKEEMSRKKGHLFLTKGLWILLLPSESDVPK